MVAHKSTSLTWTRYSKGPVRRELRRCGDSRATAAVAAADRAAVGGGVQRGSEHRYALGRYCNSIQGII